MSDSSLINRLVRRAASRARCGARYIDRQANPSLPLIPASVGRLRPIFKIQTRPMNNLRGDAGLGKKMARVRPNRLGGVIEANPESSKPKKGVAHRPFGHFPFLFPLRFCCFITFLAATSVARFP